MTRTKCVNPLQWPSVVDILFHHVFLHETKRNIFGKNLAQQESEQIKGNSVYLWV